ncbi:GNAT family N-acetyltransferase [Iodobacter arcticus]|uniref:GNAT family N-acetyltransferase n=1 Tax=Iodobacter arcticus TaxID=590593 RepID=A0ABW2QXA5_9NEIS
MTNEAQTLNTAKHAITVIRPAQAADAQAISQIRVAAWQAAYPPFMPKDFLKTLNPSAQLESLQARLSAPSRDFYLAIADQQNQSLGFYMLGKPRFESSENTTELWALNVAPSAWRSGLGFQLMQDAITKATHFAYQRILLWCISENHAARQLYERCGFKNTGETRSTTALTGHPLHEVCYELQLN